jgi:hypothetical protein
LSHLPSSDFLRISDFDIYFPDAPGVRHDAMASMRVRRPAGKVKDEVERASEGVQKKNGSPKRPVDVQSVLRRTKHPKAPTIVP